MDIFKSLWHKILAVVIFMLGIGALIFKFISNRDQEKFKEKVKELNKERHIIQGKEEIVEEERNKLKNDVKINEEERKRIERIKENRGASVSDAKDRLKKFLESTGE